jgi:hypothetical protein
MRTRLLAVVITWMFCSAAQTEERFALVGPGVESCAEFGSFYKKDPHAARLMFESWARGFMSGVNTELDSRGESMRMLSADGLFSYIRYRCDEHPLLNVYSIVSDYFKSLPEFPPPSK